MSREHDAPDADAPVTIQLSPTARIHTFPKRKTKFTAQDHEDMSDARRVLFLRQAIRQLEAMHHCLHEVFGEVVRTDDAWPFFSVRKIQDYIDKDKFELFTRNPQLLEAARAATQIQIGQNMAKLSKALLAHTGDTLSSTSGLDLRANSHTLKLSEEALQTIRDVIECATPEEQAALAKVARVTQHGLRTMFNMGAPLSGVSQKAIDAIAPEPVPSTYEFDTAYLPVRRKYLRLAEHWLHTCASEMTLMKIDLLADYKTPDRRANRQQDMFEGALVEVTPPQRSFIAADQQSTRDLEQAGRTLHLALIS